MLSYWNYNNNDNICRKLKKNLMRLANKKIADHKQYRRDLLVNIEL